MISKKFKKKLIDNISILFLIIIIVLLIYEYYNKIIIENFENFENFEDYPAIKIDNLFKNQDVDVVCSGPSSENVKIKSNNIVCANFSILNSSVNNVKNLNKNIYWITGPHFYRDGYGKNMKNYKKQFIF